MIALRALLLWCAIVPMAIANGFLRDSVLVGVLGPFAARLCSGVILCLAILGWTYLTIPWIGHPNLSACFAIGAYWLTLTIVFEFTFGRLVAKHTWEELLRAYRFEGGDIWPIILAVVAASPFIAAKLRRHG